jgi:hypothetical protein
MSNNSINCRKIFFETNRLVFINFTPLSFG